MTAKKEKVYYVAVLRGKDTNTGDYKMRFVTDLPGHNTAVWEDGKAPFPMSSGLAKEVVYGLCVNCHLAMVVDAEWLTELKNPKVIEEEN